MKVLIVGLGSIAQKHIEVLKKLVPSVEIFALRSDKNAAPVASVTNIYDLKQANFAFDFAIVSNPTVCHYDTIDTLIDENINLFIEKPPLHSLLGVDKLLEKIEQKKLQTYVACNLRFHPCLQFLKKHLDIGSQIINEVNIYCGSYLPDWRANKNFREIYSAQEAMGGGVHLDLFHELDYTYWLFGRPSQTNVTTERKSSLNIDAIDYANYALSYPTFTANIVLNYYRRDAKRQIEIVFEHETWTIDLLKNRIIKNDSEVVFEAENHHIFDTYLKQMEVYLEELKTKSTKSNTFLESIEVLKICLNHE